MATEQAKKVLKFAVALGEAVDKSLVDNKVTVIDALNFFEPLQLAAPAFENFDQLKLEIESLDEAGKAELVQFCKDELKLADEKAEHAIEAGLELVGSIYLFVKGLKQ